MELERMLDPEGPSRYHARSFLDVGKELRQYGDYEDSERLLHLAAEFDAENPVVYDELDATYVAQGKLKKARRASERAASLGPTPERWLRLAARWTALGRIDEAERAAARAVVDADR